MNIKNAIMVGKADKSFYRRVILLVLVGLAAILFAWSARSRMTPAPAPIVNAVSLPHVSDSAYWINSAPINFDTVSTRAILIEIWEFSCINCVRTIPHIRAWHQQYRDSGLLVVGVHAPEFPSSEQVSVVREAVERLQISYPVMVDNEFLVWNMFENKWWPRLILLDQERRVVHDHIGEGGYEKTEQLVRKALALD